MTQISKPSQSDFASKWNFNPLRYRFAEAAIGLANLTFLSGTFAYAASAFAWEPVILTALAAFSFSVRYFSNTLHRKAAAVDSFYEDTIATEQLLKSKPELAEKLDLFKTEFSKLCKKAGFNKEVRFLIPPDNETNARINMCGVYIIKESDDRKPDIFFITEHTLNDLSLKELCATAGHEISHLKLSPNRQSLLNDGLIDLHFNMMILSIFTGYFYAAAMHYAVREIGKSLRATEISMDERRADYNSLGLFPDREALTDTLLKLRRNMMQKIPDSMRRKVRRGFQAPYPIPAIRNKLNERNYKISKAFHEKHKLPMPK